MKVVISSQVVLSQVPEGPIAAYLGSFVDWLSSKGYSVRCIHRQVFLAASFSRWLRQRALALQDLDNDHLTQYLLYRARRSRPQCGDHAALSHVIDFLRCEGLVEDERPEVPDPSSLACCIRAYEVYLREERALAAVTVSDYVPFVREFLSHRFGTGTADLSRVNAADVVGFVERQAQRLHKRRAKLMTSALRSFLRYARFCGEIDVDLAEAVPSVPNWSMTSIPRAVSSKQVRQLLASVDQGTPTGRRDYAVLLLLARLGLRSNEVASLTFDDIDWNMGLLSVQGKSGHRNLLPLPNDVGEAIAAYLKNGRPPSTSRRVFLSVKPPVRAFKGSCAVGAIVKRHLLRSGIDAPTLGAHQFRHGLATEMLRRGASLGEIGDLLGHRYPQTTMIYTKVDIQALRRIAPPWPRSAR